MTVDKLGLIPPNVDPTWYAPLTVISTCMEVNVAVMCASIPVFWPILKQIGFGRITVVKEVEVKSEPRRRLTADEQSEYDEELQLTFDPVRSKSMYPLRPSLSEATSARTFARSSK